jgi:tetratricopeptide (TPR) repeat protein
MGAVYLAHDTRLNRDVALKIFAGGDERSPLARYELLNEARAAAALNHPHIASVHDVLDVDGKVAIVFEYVAGETLADRLQRGAVAAAEAMRLGAQLADALAAAHQHAIVHRDLKPGNIAITPEGQIKVLDFGVARVVPAADHDPTSAQTTVAGFVGTMGYAAPEQCLGQTVDARADLFSLGVILFEMVTGRRPFGGREPSTVLRAMLSESPPRARTLARGVPAELDDLIAQLLLPDPGRRPQTAAEVGRALRGSTPTERDQSVVMPTPRRPWVMAVLIASALATGALVSSLVFDRETPWETPVAARSPVVAIMPLTNASGDSSRDYVATGVAENLVTRLAGVPTLTVLSRAAVNEAHRRQPDLALLARELDASYLVDGSVQQSGRQLRIDLRLVQPDGKVAWADNVQGDLDQIFELQHRLTAAVAQALEVRLSAADRASLAEQPTLNPQAFAAYSRGRALLDRRDIKGNTQAALAAFDEAIQLDPRFADAHAARGEALWDIYLGNKDPSFAQAAVNAGFEALRLAPNRANVRYSLALTLKARGELDNAAEELQRVLAIRPNHDDARRELGDVFARQGKIDAAIVEFRSAIAVRPNYWPHHNALGISLLRAARYEEAAEAFGRTVALQPDNASAHANLGVAYHFLDRLDQALASYQRAVELRPSSSAYSNIGTIHYRRGEYAQAIAAYEAALKLVPNAAATNRNLGDAYRKLGRVTQARAAYRNAVDLAQADLSVNPRDPVGHASLALYAAKAGDFELARRHVRISQTLAPAHVEVLYRVAAVHALTNDSRAALEALQAAVAGGYSRSEVAADDDFERLRDHPEFAALITNFRR